MMHAPLPIGIAETARGLLVSLPPQLPLVVSLRKAFPGLQAGDAAWTYLVPPARTAARRLEDWMAEVELQARAEARRRAWSASDVEWDAASAPAAPSTSAAAPVAIVALPGKRTARQVLQLLEFMAAGAVLVVAMREGSRRYRLAPTGRRVGAAVAERAIGARLVVPGNDGLFGPEWSQTWRAPTSEEVHAATQRRRTRRPRRDRAGADGPVGPVRSPDQGRSRGAGQKGQAGAVVAHRGRPAAARRTALVEAASA